jgi:hypothetical protein
MNINCQIKKYIENVYYNLNNHKFFTKLETFTLRQVFEIV